MKIKIQLGMAPIWELLLSGFVAYYSHEHEGYYGTPHGAQSAKSARDGQAGSCGLGLIEAEGWQLTGCPANVVGARWLASSGNEFRLSFSDGGLFVEYAGRRHGLRDDWRAILQYAASAGKITVYETREPEWLPWETADRS